MRGRKGRGKGKKNFKKRGGKAGFPSQSRQEEFEEDYEDEYYEVEETEDDGAERSVDSLEKDGNIAVDLLSKKIQLRKLVDEFKSKTITDDIYAPESDELRYSSISAEHEDGRKRPENSQKGKEAEGPSSKRKAANGRQKPEGKKNKPEAIEDEEVMRIIGELEKEIDTSFPELLDVGDQEVNKPPEKVNKPPEKVNKPPEKVNKPPEKVNKPPEKVNKPPEKIKIQIEQTNVLRHDSNVPNVKTDSNKKPCTGKIQIKFDEEREKAKENILLEQKMLAM